MTGSDIKTLDGKTVHLTGRFASMTRTEAAELILRCDGELVPTVTPRTAIVVIGQAGLPLRQHGRISPALAKAQRLNRAGHSIEIVCEEDLLARLGLEHQPDVQGLFTTFQLCRLLNVPRDRFGRWMKDGFLQPVK